MEDRGAARWKKLTYRYIDGCGTGQSVNIQVVHRGLDHPLRNPINPDITRTFRRVQISLAITGNFTLSTQAFISTKGCALEYVPKVMSMPFM